MPFRIFKRGKAKRQWRKSRHIEPLSKGGIVRRIDGTRISVERNSELSGKAIHVDLETGSYLGGEFLIRKGDFKRIKRRDE